MARIGYLYMKKHKKIVINIIVFILDEVSVLSLR